MDTAVIAIYNGIVSRWTSNEPNHSLEPFTGPRLALLEGRKIFDPPCGLGDLLACVLEWYYRKVRGISNGVVVPQGCPAMFREAQSRYPAKKQDVSRIKITE